MGMSSYIGAPEDERGYWDDKVQPEPEEEGDNEPYYIPCPKCGMAITWDSDVHYNVGWVDAVEAAAKIADDESQPQVAARIRELKRVGEDR